MHNTERRSKQIDPFNQSNYSIESLDDEIKADQTCKVLLKEYHQYLLKNKGFFPLESGSMASGADYYLRDFMIDNRRINIFDISPELIYGFAGNWYIVNTLEPNMVELESILNGVNHFYSFCAEKKMINLTMAEKVSQACSHHEYYRQRIETFNTLSGDGFTTWNNACPLLIS
ncbi:MAG: hypothetical protein J7K90_05345 [Desulfuromusa sp.]|nr:hypothetical protein [Desulfuromusa sp.]